MTRAQFIRECVLVPLFLGIGLGMIWIAGVMFE